MFLGRINIKLKGESGAGGAGGQTAENTAKNYEIDSSAAWQNKLKPQGGNPLDVENMSHAERVETIKKQLGVSDDLAERYAKAIESYGSDPQGMNSRTASDLESFIKNANRWAGGNTYHSLASSAEGFDKSRSVGETLNLNGTSTWTSNKEKADGDVVLVSATQSKGTGINHLSVHSGDKEVIASDASRYKIKKKYWEGKTLYVAVEEI
jgi:hypothetical protein